MTTLIRRSGFGWQPFGGSDANTNKGLVIHYDGSKQHLESLPHGECVEYWKETRAAHKRKGWLDIGYAYGVCPHGFVFEGRGYGKEQAAQLSDPGHIRDGNTRYCSVTLMSGPGERVPERQLEGVRWLRDKLIREHGMSVDVFGHKDFSDTSCPGDVAYKLVRDHAFSAPRSEVRRTLKVTSPFMRGDDVREAQKLLGMPVRERDGIYGPDTGAYVFRYKVKHGFDRNNILGSGTWKELLKGEGNG